MIEEIEHQPTLGEPPRPLPPRPSKQRGRTLISALSAAALLLVVGVGLVQRMASSLVEPLPAVTAPEPAKLTARGQVRPIAQARVGTLSGGVVSRLVVAPGDAVFENQEIAWVRGVNGTEIVGAPFPGTVTSVLVRLGDTILPGAVVATVGDLSHLQVETTDVDEFIIAHLRPGQRVTVLIQALNQELLGQVRTVSLEPVTTSAGDDQYPVAIDLFDAPRELRPGMTARIKFFEEALG